MLKIGNNNNTIIKLVKIANEIKIPIAKESFVPHYIMLTNRNQSLFINKLVSSSNYWLSKTE